jgi:acetolactate synthase small subunit
MQAFHIHYRNTQGTLMRILTAVSRRALDITYLHAETVPDDENYKVTLLLDVNPKQVGQLRRDWYAIMDVTDVRSAPAESIAQAWSGTLGHPPSSATDETVRAARA